MLGKYLNLACGITLSFGLTASLVQAQSRFVCEPTSKNGKEITAIWPVPYLSSNGALCFDVRRLPAYSGQNCVTNGGSIRWTGLTIVSVDGESEGRDATSFRVVKPVVETERIEYIIEWSRNSSWAPMQHVKIDRLSGSALSYFTRTQGSESYQCHLEKRQP